MKTIFIDSDVILDFLLERKGYDFAMAIFFFGFNKKYLVISSSVILSNVYYVARKVLGHTETIERLKKIRKFLKIIYISEKSFDNALNSGFTDFEDALQYFAALEFKSNYIITRNKKDFRASKIKVLTTEEFLISENL